MLQHNGFVDEGWRDSDSNLPRWAVVRTIDTAQSSLEEEQEQKMEQIQVRPWLLLKRVLPPGKYMTDKYMTKTKGSQALNRKGNQARTVSLGHILGYSTISWLHLLTKKKGVPEQSINIFIFNLIVGCKCNILKTSPLSRLPRRR